METRQIKPAEKLYFLKRHVPGNSKEAIDGYFMVPSENAYEEARKLLDVVMVTLSQLPMHLEKNG